MMTASARGCRRRCSPSSRPQTLLSRITFFLAEIVTPTDTSQYPPPHRYHWVRPTNFPPSHKHCMHTCTDANKIDLTFIYPLFLKIVGCFFIQRIQVFQTKDTRVSETQRNDIINTLKTLLLDGADIKNEIKYPHYTSIGIYLFNWPF